MPGLVELGLQFSVRGLESQDGSDPGQIESVVEELADLPEADEVIVAVATSATLAAGWIDKASSLVEAKVLGSTAHQLGGYGDPVEATGPIGTLIGPRRPDPRRFCKTTCIRHGLQGITNL